jgi:hypothetical protein
MTILPCLAAAQIRLALARLRRHFAVGRQPFAVPELALAATETRK